MALTDPVLAQVQLFFEQRLTLVQNRYLDLDQLRHHDYCLIDSVHFARQRRQKEVLPRWLDWLLSVNDTALNDLVFRELSISQPSSLLLLDLKYYLQPELVSQWVNSAIKQTTVHSALAWQFACRHQLDIKGLSFDKSLGADAFWYLACSGRADKLAILKQLKSSVASSALSNPYILLATHMLGEWQDEAELILMLSQITEISDTALMFLMASAADPIQNRIVNTLAAQQSTIKKAIAAMGFSGQLKFVPLLTELAQQKSSADIATNALTVLLGANDADNLIDHKDISFLVPEKSGRKLAGADINLINVARVWRSGNTMQRQLAECYRFLAQPTTAFRHPTILLGAYSDD